MEFDFHVMMRWIQDLDPLAIEVGADNYGFNLPEPNPPQVRELLSTLRNCGYAVYEKKSLQRLVGDMIHKIDVKLSSSNH